MASSADGIEVLQAPSPGPAKPVFVQLLILTVASMLISAVLLMGGIYYLAKSGRLAGVAATVRAPTAAKAEAIAVPSTHPVVLEPMVVNLADQDGRAYLRLGLTLRVVDPELKKGDKAEEEKPKEPKGLGDADAAVRDTVLEVLGRQTATTLLAPQGREQLKTELKAAIVQHNPELKVTEVFFTEFLVQR